MCAKMGAHLTIGSDMDWRYFKTGGSNARKDGSKEATLRGNFDHYGLLPPMLVRVDIGHLSFGRSMQVDAIVCDIPYGIRAGTLDTSASGIQSMHEIIAKLLEAAAIHLRIGGRLVFLQPTTEYGEFSDAIMHPVLCLLFAPLEKIHDSWSRRLVVMVKEKEYEEGMVAEIKSSTGDTIDSKQESAVKRQKTDE